MSIKLKALGLGLLAVLATSAFAVINASANGTGGHFVSDVEHTVIVGTEGPGESHRLHFTAVGSEGIIGCTNVTYHGTATTKTVESLTITPTYENCHTTPGPEPKVVVTHNECTYTFTVTPGTTNTTEQEVHLICPAGKAIEIHHPNCTITVPPQTVKNAATYTTVTENNKHAITIDINASFSTQYHGGICIFLGTGHEGKLNGSVTVKGTDTLGNQVGITAT